MGVAEIGLAFVCVNYAVIWDYCVAINLAGRRMGNSVQRTNEEEGSRNANGLNGIVVVRDIDIFRGGDLDFNAKSFKNDEGTFKSGKCRPVSGDGVISQADIAGPHTELSARSVRCFDRRDSAAASVDATRV